MHVSALAIGDVDKCLLTSEEQVKNK